MSGERAKTLLWMTPAIADQIIAHCQEYYPKEACGLLAGSSVAPETQMIPEQRVVQVYPMMNVENSPIGYSMDPREQLRIDKFMRQRQQKLVGIYHSHTATDAYPSPVDVRMAISPDVSYVLVSLKDRAKPLIKSYRILDGSILEEDVLVEERTV